MRASKPYSQTPTLQQTVGYIVLSNLNTHTVADSNKVNIRLLE
jgi:hypothetical protein